MFWVIKQVLVTVNNKTKQNFLVQRWLSDYNGIKL